MGTIQIDNKNMTTAEANKNQARKYTEHYKLVSASFLTIEYLLDYLNELAESGWQIVSDSRIVYDAPGEHSIILDKVLFINTNTAESSKN